VDEGKQSNCQQARSRAGRISRARRILAVAFLFGWVGSHAEDMATQANHQSLDDAWWTGPILAASASTLPQGHALVEPYVYDVITYGHNDSQGHRVSTPHVNDFGTQSYILYGITDRISGGLIPRFGYEEASAGPSSSGLQVGDITLQGQYRLTQFQEGSWIPTTSFVVGETLPTGKYDHLDQHPADGFGAGAYTTILSLYAQDYFWLPTGRILRSRLDLSYSLSSQPSLRGVSVYGTGPGFAGHANPGNTFTVDSSYEYSLTRSWVLALDVVYEHDASTSVTGSYPAANGVAPAIIQQSSGAGWSLGFAPALEYNWSAKMGVIVGARYIPIGHGSSITVTPVAAINMVF
jgi:hypothetical protein